jgi:hypothetical protein
VPGYFPLMNRLADPVFGWKYRLFRLQKFARYGERCHFRGPGLMFLLIVLAFPACAQEFVPEHVVFPITYFRPDVRHLAPISLEFGTGFCLDKDCRFVGTNYHVAKLMGDNVRIRGVHSAHRYLDSDQGDKGARSVKLFGGGSLKFTPAHDLAIYEMQHPLKGLHGIDFEVDDLEKGTEARICGYPFNWNPKRRLVCWQGRFIDKTDQGLLAFSYEEGDVHGGASGGIVVDTKTKNIIGILNAVGNGIDRVALAVPIKQLSDFVAREQPYLQAILFPKTVFVSPVATDIYGPRSWPRGRGLSSRSVEPLEVVKLRRTAQHLADSMRNFAAIETFAWGHGNLEPDTADAYETLIVDGGQRWRHSESPELYDNVPLPPLNNSVVPGDEWSLLPRMVGTELNLRISQAADAIVSGKLVHVFQYAANAEDGVCKFATVEKKLIFQRRTTKSYDCHGEVWTDEQGTIIRISQAMDLQGPWYHFWSVITYGWVEKDGQQYRLPVTINTQAERGQMYWCRGLFTDYQMIGESNARMVLPNEPPEGQELRF